MTLEDVTEKWNIPTIDNRFICIADMGHAELCAEVSSCFNQQGLYFPVFLFPDVNTIANDNHVSKSDGYISQIIGHETAVLINNSIARMTGCNHVIYVGLSDFQKSYLSRYKLPIIDIQDSTEIEVKLSPFTKLPNEILRCRKENYLAGLYNASLEKKRLVIDEDALDCEINTQSGEGIVVIEKVRKHPTLPIVAVNYALSINADIRIAEELSEEQEQSVENKLQKWQEDRSYNQLRKVLNQVEKRVAGIEFEKYKFATFFTNGLPYSLAIKNKIPSTHVHLSLRPDLFICNSIGFETGDRFHSAVVFSPKFFHDEETDMVIETMSNQGYFVRPLLGKQATSHNLDFHAQHFPYDILHICSHGGEASGYTVVQKFKDRKGTEHILEFDEVVSFAPVPGRDLIGVAHKMFFRKFDGMKWMSPELKSKNIPQYVYEDMLGIISMDNDDPKNIISRDKKLKIPTSCSIHCIDDFHQGTFRILSSHHSPIVFNNSCLSWGQIARFFLSSGSRGYIGTLWNIGNTEAVSAAKTFYSLISKNTVMTSLHKAIRTIDGTDSENIYLYWGLHFTTLGPTQANSEDGKNKVFAELLRAFYSWMNKVENSTGEVKKNSLQVARDILTELVTNFGMEDLRKLKERFQSNSQKRSSAQTAELETESDIQNREFIDLPKRFISKK